MGWSIKKPFGKKKSIFNQIINVHKAAVVAVATAPVALVSPATYKDILVKNDLMGEKEAGLAVVGAKIGTSIAGGAIIGGLVASNETAAAVKAAAEKAEALKKETEALKKEAEEAAEEAKKKAEALVPAPLVSLLTPAGERERVITPVVIRPEAVENTAKAPALDWLEQLFADIASLFKG